MLLGNLNVASLCVWMCLFWPTAFFSASFCAASETFASWSVSAAQSYSQSDSTDLPLCEAYHRGDSWASPGSSCSSTQGDQEADCLPTQETDPQHHVNGHGMSSLEKMWSCLDLFWLHLYWDFTNIDVCHLFRNFKDVKFRICSHVIKCIKLN